MTLWFVMIVILVLSNFWTLMRMGASRDEASRQLESRKVEEREKWVQICPTTLDGGDAQMTTTTMMMWRRV